MAREQTHSSGAKMSPTGQVIAIMNYSEAGQGIIRGELRGLQPDQAERMFRLKTALPYTPKLHAAIEKEERAERLKEAGEEAELNLPGFESMKA